MTHETFVELGSFVAMVILAPYDLAIPITLVWGGIHLSLKGLT